jgi:hypothetical protein
MRKSLCSAGSATLKEDMRNAVRQVEREAANRPARLSAGVLSPGVLFGVLLVCRGLTGLPGCWSMGQSITADRGMQERRAGRAPESTAPIPSRVRTAAPDPRKAPHHLRCAVACGHGSTSTHLIPSGPRKFHLRWWRSPSYTPLREGAALSGARETSEISKCVCPGEVSGWLVRQIPTPVKKHGYQR